MDQLYDMVELGYNYRITEISAALGLVQLKKLDQFIKRRKELYCLYHDLLNPLPVELQDIPVHVEHAHHVLPVLVPKGMRVSIRAHLQKKGIGTSIHYTPIHQFTYYKKHGYAAESLPVAEEIGARVVTLPLHQKMSDDDVHRVVLELKSQLD